MKKDIVRAMHERKLIRSLSEARRLVHQGAVEVDGKKVKTLDVEVDEKEKIEIVKRKK